MVVISIIVTSYSWDRIHDIEGLLASVKAQNARNLELIYVIEGHKDLEYEVARKVNRLKIDARVVYNEGNPGLAEARNWGASIARGEILGFVDDDVILDPDWTQVVEETFQKHPGVVGLTGPAKPIWVGAENNWFPAAIDWLIGCTGWFDSEYAVEVGNVWGMNMAFRRSEFNMTGGFAPKSFEASRYLRSGAPSNIKQERTQFIQVKMAEDVEFSLRIRRATGRRLIYVPTMVVHSKVYPYRLTTEYICKRSRWVAYTRKNVSKSPASTRASTSFERGLLAKLLLAFLPFGKEHPANLFEFSKRTKVLLLVLCSLLVGNLVGPV